MNDLKGKLVKLFFKNGLTAEGIVDTWSANISVLNSPVGAGYLIVHETLQNVMMIRVLAPAEINSQPISWQEPLIEEPPKLAPEEKVADPLLRAQKLAELRKQQLQKQRSQIAMRLQRGASVGASTMKVRYEYPDLTKLKSTNRSKS